MGAEHDAVPDLDRLFADLAHPNPYIQTEAFTAMAEHWQAEAHAAFDCSVGSARCVAAAGFRTGAGCIRRKCHATHRRLLSLSADGTVRASCVKAYAQLASNYPGLPFSEEAMQVLRDGLQDSSPVVAVASVMALGRVGQQAVSLLLEISRGDNPAQGVAAVNAWLRSTTLLWSKGLKSCSPTQASMAMCVKHSPPLCCVCAISRRVSRPDPAG